MASRRMFARAVTDSDRFLELSFPAQALYMHLGMAADDDGFIDSAKRVARAIGASESDLSELERNGFLIFFRGSGVYVITHFLVNNSIRADRYHPTIYQAELAQLNKDSTGMYAYRQPSGSQTVDNLSPLDDQPATGGKPSANPEEDREGKTDKAREAEGNPPTLEEVRFFCQERGLKVNPDRWFHHYASLGWFVGNSKIQNWRESLLKWDSSENKGTQKTNPGQRYAQRDYSGESLEAGLANMVAMIHRGDDAV